MLRDAPDDEILRAVAASDAASAGPAVPEVTP
jgi:hypothetical protein